MLVRYAVKSPGITWVRRGRVYTGVRCHFPEMQSYLWVRSFWRCLWLWLATVVVLGFIGWGLGR